MALGVGLVVLLGGAAQALVGVTLSAFSATASNAGSAMSADTLTAPSGLTATVQPDNSTVRLAWTGTTSTWAAGHRVYRATSAGGPYTRVAEVTPATTVSYDDAPGAGSYYYVVRAFYASNWESPDSNEASASPTGVVETLDRFEFDAVGEQLSGRSFPVTVRAMTTSGTVDTSFNGTVDLTTSGASISPAVSNAFVDGVLTQTVTVTGAYSTATTITATDGASGKTGTSSSFVLHDRLYYFRDTTANTTTYCASSSYTRRDMQEGSDGAGTEATFRPASTMTYLYFCPAAIAAPDSLSAGTTTVSAYLANTAGASCSITALLSKSGPTAKSLGSGSVSVPPGATPTLYTWSFSTTGTELAVGDKLNFGLYWGSATACTSTTLYYNGAARPSRVQLQAP